MTYASEVLADNPVLYWRLDETSGTTASDSSGASHPGTYVGTMTRGAASLLADGTGNALTLTGGGHVTNPGDWNSPTGDWQNTDFVTVTCRIKPTSPGLSGDCYFSSQWSGSGANNRWVLSLDNGKVRAHVWTSVSGMVIKTAATALVAGVTHTVGLSFDGSNVRVWLDGAVDGIAAASGTLQHQTAPTAYGIEVGRVALADSTHATGITVDEFAVFGTALSAARILAQHNAAASVLTSNIYDKSGVQREAYQLTGSGLAARSFVKR